ncbi:hypothetical protein ACCO45_009930 [Purpureocillium lilacinum]|uniref:Uncharacterized protein n=1 Tax=Purpureocillium lilacinum TaxID=33203 RepID=A0ACC4DDE1_PURLI
MATSSVLAYDSSSEESFNFDDELCLPKRAKTDEEKEQRRIERVLRNRRAAHFSRERRRQEVESLEEYNKALERRLIDVRRANAVMMTKLRRIQRARGHLAWSPCADVSVISPTDRVILRQAHSENSISHSTAVSHANDHFTSELPDNIGCPSVDPACLSHSSTGLRLDTQDRTSNLDNDFRLSIAAVADSSDWGDTLALGNVVDVSIDLQRDDNAGNAFGLGLTFNDELVTEAANVVTDILVSRCSAADDALEPEKQDEPSDTPSILYSKDSSTLTMSNEYLARDHVQARQRNGVFAYPTVDNCHSVPLHSKWNSSK